jgi:hypothetical protein
MSVVTSIPWNRVVRDSLDQVCYFNLKILCSSIWSKQVLDSLPRAIYPDEFAPSQIPFSYQVIMGIILSCIEGVRHVRGS